MMVWWILFIVMWLMILFGLPHLSWRIACWKEVNRQGSSPTSNSRKPFVMEIGESECRLGKRFVTGNARGPRPNPGDVLYLVDGERRIPVVLRRVKTMSMKEEGKGIVLRLVLFGAGRGELSEKAFLTNTRAKKSRESQEEEKTVAVHYPVVVRTRFRAIFGSGLLGLGAALLCAACIYTGITHPELVAGAAIGGFSSMIMTIVAFILLAFYLGFKLTIVSEDRVRVRNYFRTTEYHINNLLFHTYLSQDKKEIWHLQLRDGAGTVVCDITDKQKRYEEAHEAFRLARARRQKRDLYQYLLERIFYIPAEFIRDEESGEMSAEPLIMVSEKTGQESIFLFDDEKAMQNDIGEEKYNSVIETRLEDAVPYMEKYKIDRLVAFLNSPMSPDILEINTEKWEEIRYWGRNHFISL